MIVLYEISIPISTLSSRDETCLPGSTGFSDVANTFPDDPTNSPYRFVNAVPRPLWAPMMSTEIGDILLAVCENLVLM
jgi:hypothetical protein